MQTPLKGPAPYWVLLGYNYCALRSLLLFIFTSTELGIFFFFSSIADPNFPLYLSRSLLFYRLFFVAVWPSSSFSLLYVLFSIILSPSFPIYLTEKGLKTETRKRRVVLINGRIVFAFFVARRKSLCLPNSNSPTYLFRSKIASLCVFVHPTSSSLSILVSEHFSFVP